jgi:3-methyladenine DNA glycosylase AlkD
MLNTDQIQRELKQCASKEKARILQRFFKTGPGEYAEGDIFLGVMVPDTRKLAKKYARSSLRQIQFLLHSPLHEERLLALLILVAQFAQADTKAQDKIYGCYLKNTRYINNWDLVDVSAPQIVGAYLADKKRGALYTLARSRSLWERRIAVVATFYFIRKNDFRDILRIAKLLLPDTEALIHKAVGWMLREVGKRDRRALEKFLVRERQCMPRTMLRYALEHFSPSRRKQLLARVKQRQCDRKN